MRVFDEDSVNDTVFEERQYQAEARKEKNRILAMTDSKKKQAEWKRLFPPYTQDDSYLESTSGVW